MTGEQIHNLVTEVDKQMETSSSRYPYELIIVAVVLSVGIIFLGLAAHEQHDVVSLPPEDRGREELEMQNL
ncbi:hypothetical protein OUZ56_021646 [Daphnia magna]|uniref:Uncharacterized protein n=1 Tax=Daphnia magna TaxID=35525 RepID=A0ABR0AU38_9CRUS|nr:hypothetical protein OUZ56_021646 [Daphnia magna]